MFLSFLKSKDEEALMVLIIDCMDDYDSHLLKKRMEEKKINFTAFNDVERALKFLKKHKVDLILLEILIIPGGVRGGISLIESIRRRIKKIPFVVYTYVFDAKEILKNKDIPVFPKLEFFEWELVDKIEKILQKKS